MRLSLQESAYIFLAAFSVSEPCTTSTICLNRASTISNSTCLPNSENMSGNGIPPTLCPPLVIPRALFPIVADRTRRHFARGEPRIAGSSGQTKRQFYFRKDARGTAVGSVRRSGRGLGLRGTPRHHTPTSGPSTFLQQWRLVGEWSSPATFLVHSHPMGRRWNTVGDDKQLAKAGFRVGRNVKVG